MSIRPSPSAPSPVLMPKPAHPGSGPVTRPVLHVLVLDADAIAGARLARWLHRHGCAVAPVCTIDEATAVLVSSRFNLLIADVDLMGSAGFSWLEQLCHRSPRPAVILMPSRLTLQTAAHAARLPLAGYLPKPVDHQALLALLGRLAGVTGC